MNGRMARHHGGCLLMLLVAVAGSGCGTVSQRRFDDSRLRIQALQAENEQLHDVALNVRSQNRDLAARALDDARKLRALEETNRRLERSILAYQDETRHMAAILDQLRSQVRLAVTDDTTISLRDSLRRVPEEFPDVRYDAETLTFHLPAERLFDGGTESLSDEAGRWLDAIGTELRAAAQTAPGGRWVLEVGSLPLAQGVQLASDRGDDPEASARWRQQKLRARIEHASGLDGALFGVRTDSPSDGVVRASADGEGWVALRVVPLKVTNAR